jgi:phage-Barnase-EndoU-ColicinE5/D-RelE like nuclease3
VEILCFFSLKKQRLKRKAGMALIKKDRSFASNKMNFETQINELYEECLANIEQFHRKIDLFEIPINLASKIKEETNIDLNGFWVCIDNFGILHALENHGNPISEARRGQVAIEKTDFITMIDVFLNPDAIKYLGKTRHSQKDMIQFEKKIDDKIFVVKEVRMVTSSKKKKLNRLVFHTMYKIKATN